MPFTAAPFSFSCDPVDRRLHRRILIQPIGEDSGAAYMQATLPFLPATVFIHISAHSSFAIAFDSKIILGLLQALSFFIHPLTRVLCIMPISVLVLRKA